MPTITRRLRRGSTGSEVKTLQSILNQKVPIAKLPNRVKLAVDGIFGPKTERAVRTFQQLNKPLKIDGIVGENTAPALGLAYKGPGKKSSKGPRQKDLTPSPNLAIDAKAIDLARKQVDAALQAAIPDAQQKIRAYYGCIRAMLDAKREVDTVLHFAQAQKVVTAIAETGIITLITMGSASLLAPRIMAYAKNVKNARLVLFLTLKEGAVAANVFAGMAVPIGAALAKAILIKRFSTDDGIGLLQTVVNNALAAGFSKTNYDAKGGAMGILGILYAAGMAYMDAQMALQKQRMEIAFKKNITIEKVKTWVPWNMRLLGSNEKHLYEQLKAYYYYKSEAKIRKVQMDMAMKLVAFFRAVRKDDNLIKEIIKLQAKLQKQ